MKLKKRFIITALLALAVLTAIILLKYFNPIIFMPDEIIEKDILKNIPLGTSMEEAVKYFEEQGWSKGSQSQNEPWSKVDSERFLNDPTANSFIFVLDKLGSYYVDVVIKFDADSPDRNLIEVEVRSYIAP